MSLRRALSPGNVNYLQSIGALHLSERTGHPAKSPPPLPRQTRPREQAPPAPAFRQEQIRPNRSWFVKLVLWILVLIAACIAVGRLSASPAVTTTGSSNGENSEAAPRPQGDSEIIEVEALPDPGKSTQGLPPHRSIGLPASHGPEESSQLSSRAHFDRSARQLLTWERYGPPLLILITVLAALGSAGIFEYRKHRRAKGKKWQRIPVTHRIQPSCPVAIPDSGPDALAIPSLSESARGATALPPSLGSLPRKPWVDPGTWPTSIPVPTPLEALPLLAGDDAREFVYDKYAPWWLGHFSFRGNTRAENQDAALQFELKGSRVTILADGLGGAPHGQRASRIAVLAAAKAIFARRETCPSCWTSEAFISAQSAIELQAEKLRIDPSKFRGGLQTTLLIVVATENEVHYRMIGDGGLIHLHADGTIKELVAAQKGEAANQVGGCLGPVRFGLDEAGKTLWQPGDLIVLGTDGAFDVYRSALDFGGAFRNSLAKRKDFSGNLHQLTAETVLEIAQWVNEQGDPCSDDNITLAVVGTGKAPDYVTGRYPETIEEKEAAPSVERTVIRVA
jgi:serine/threonine protein phosphatase PrpC